MANFGDILSNLTIGALQSVRRNAGNTAFEAFTTGNTTALFIHTAARTTYATTAQTLYSDTIPAATLNANGDSIEASYSGLFDASNGGTIFSVLFAGTTILSSDDFNSLLMDSYDWEIKVLISRVNNTKARATVTLQVWGIDPVVKQTDISSLNFTTTDYDLVLRAENALGAGDVTAKLAVGKYVAAPALTELSALTGIWAAYEADSYTDADGSNAGNWTDGSGNGRTATVTGTPTQETNELNGERIIRLGADSNDYFTVPSMSSLTAGAIVQVLKVTDITTSGGDDFGSSVDTSHYPNAAGATQIYDDFGSTVRKGLLTSVLTILNTWHVVYKWSASNDWGLMQDYATVFTTATSTVGFSSTPRIGFNGTQYMKCDIAATYLFSVKPSAATLAKLRARIEQKYGV